MRMRLRKTLFPGLGSLGSWVLAFVVLMPASASGQCDAFYRELATVPHVSLTIATAGFTSVWDGERYEGCEVEFETNDSTRSETAVPNFVPDPGTRLFRDGWRMRNDIGADGPGSGVYGIQRGTVLCVIRWERPAYIDDDGEFVQSDSLAMGIQCRDDARRPSRDPAG